MPSTHEDDDDRDLEPGSARVVGRGFLPGDLVHAKSGGPVLTILDVGRDTGILVCQFWDELQCRTEAFMPAMLAHHNE